MEGTLHGASSVHVLRHAVLEAFRDALEHAQTLHQWMAESLALDTHMKVELAV